VREIARPILDSLGLELFDLEFIRRGRKGFLRITIDKGGGVSLDDCQRVSQSLGHALDVEDPIPYGYTLEVTSPGLDRPLKQAQDYARYAGRLARLKLAAPWRGQAVVIGRLRGLQADRIALEINGEEIDLPLADVVRANLEVEW
jgi:ribosome maturation factor RimP